MKKTKSEDDDQEFDFNLHFKRMEEKINQAEDENNDNEELKEMIEVYKTNAIRKLVEKSGNLKNDMESRMKENAKILENVINLNCRVTNEKNTQKTLFVKGNTVNNSTDILDTGSKGLVNNMASKSFPKINCNQFRSGMINPRNSFLYCMRNNKLSEEFRMINSNNYLKEDGTSTKNAKNNLKAKNIACSLFTGNTTIGNINTNVGAGLSSLFIKKK